MCNYLHHKCTRNRNFLHGKCVYLCHLMELFCTFHCAIICTALDLIGIERKETSHIKGHKAAI